VVDASVVAKWVLPGEPYQENAIRLKEDHVSGKVELCAPTFMVQEVANALWRAAKLGRIVEEDAKEALSALGDMRIGLHELNWTQASQALSTACEFDLTIYDSSYLFLAEKAKCQFITADNKLYEAAKEHFRAVYIKNYR